MKVLHLGVFGMINDTDVLSWHMICTLVHLSDIN